MSYTIQTEASYTRPFSPLLSRMHAFLGQFYFTWPANATLPTETFETSSFSCESVGKLTLDARQRETEILSLEVSTKIFEKTLWRTSGEEKFANFALYSRVERADKVQSRLQKRKRNARVKLFDPIRWVVCKSIRTKFIKILWDFLLF